MDLHNDGKVVSLAASVAMLALAAVNAFAIRVHFLARPPLIIRGAARPPAAADGATLLPTGAAGAAAGAGGGTGVGSPVATAPVTAAAAATAATPTGGGGLACCSTTRARARVACRRECSTLSAAVVVHGLVAFGCATYGVASLVPSARSAMVADSWPMLAGTWALGLAPFILALHVVAQHWQGTAGYMAGGHRTAAPDPVAYRPVLWGVAALIASLTMACISTVYDAHPAIFFGVGTLLLYMATILVSLTRSGARLLAVTRDIHRSLTAASASMAAAAALPPPSCSSVVIPPLPLAGQPAFTSPTAGAIVVTPHGCEPPVTAGATAVAAGSGAPTSGRRADLSAPPATTNGGATVAALSGSTVLHLRVPITPRVSPPGGGGGGGGDQLAAMPPPTSPSNLQNPSAHSAVPSMPSGEAPPPRAHGSGRPAGPPGPLAALPSVVTSPPYGSMMGSGPAAASAPHPGSTPLASVGEPAAHPPGATGGGGGSGGSGGSDAWAVPLHSPAGGAGGVGGGGGGGGYEGGKRVLPPLPSHRYAGTLQAADGSAALLASVPLATAPGITLAGPCSPLPLATALPLPLPLPLSDQLLVTGRSPFAPLLELSPLVSTASPRLATRSGTGSARVPPLGSYGMQPADSPSDSAHMRLTRRAAVPLSPGRPPSATATTCAPSSGPTLLLQPLPLPPSSVGMALTSARTAVVTAASAIPAGTSQSAAIGSVLPVSTLLSTVHSDATGRMRTPATGGGGVVGGAGGSDAAVRLATRARERTTAQLKLVREHTATIATKARRTTAFLTVAWVGCVSLAVCLVQYSLIVTPGTDERSLWSAGVRLAVLALGAALTMLVWPDKARWDRSKIMPAVRQYVEAHRG